MLMMKRTSLPLITEILIFLVKKNQGFCGNYSVNEKPGAFIQVQKVKNVQRGQPEILSTVLTALC